MAADMDCPRCGMEESERFDAPKHRCILCKQAEITPELTAEFQQRYGFQADRFPSVRTVLAFLKSMKAAGLVEVPP